MFGVNAGYDSRPLTITAPAAATGNNTGFFQQVAVGAEALNKDLHFNATALIPVGNTRQSLTSAFEATTLGSINLDASYAISRSFDATLGYYYQWGDWAAASGSGVKGRLAYAINNGLTAGVTISYDNAFDTRISGDITYRFNTPKTNVASHGNNNLIAALSSTLPNRDVRVLTRSVQQVQALWICNDDRIGYGTSLDRWDLTNMNSDTSGYVSHVTYGAPLYVNNNYALYSYSGSIVCERSVLP